MTVRKLIRFVASLFATMLVLMADMPLAASASADSAPQGDALVELRDPPRIKVRRGKWIEVNLAQQRLTAWENGSPVMSTPISSGTSRFPTVRGTFRIYKKYERQRMRGPDYDLPNVPHVMYFYKTYSLHGTYWHNNFGRPMSHGCVNLPLASADWLFVWAPRGTPIVVH